MQAVYIRLLPGLRGVQYPASVSWTHPANVVPSCTEYKDRAAPPIGGPTLHHSGVKTVQRREREGHDSYQEVEVNIYIDIYICVCDKYLIEMLALL